MKKLITILALGVCLAGYSQTSTNTDGGMWVTGPITNAIKFFESFPGTNWWIAPYGTYDLTAKKAGGGLFVGYKLTDFTVPFIRAEWLDGAVWTAQGGMQLQAPITLGGTITATPFTFASIATPISGTSNNGSPIGIMAAGLELSINKTFAILADYEHWTGGGFNDDMIRGGVKIQF